MTNKNKIGFSDLKTLSCPDPMVITGTSQTFGYEGAMPRFFYENHLDVNYLADWARPITDRIRQQAEELAELSGMPMIDCNQYKDRKDDLIEKRMGEIQVRHGDVIAVFKSMENCGSFIDLKAP